MATEEPIVTFKAGKVDIDEASSLATPNATPGQIKVLRNPDDPMFSSFIWKPRPQKKKNRLGGGPSSSTTIPTDTDEQDELLLFPGDAEWYHVPECTTGRVFCLRFKSSGAKHVFWMQSPTDKGKQLGELSEQDNIISEEIKKILDSGSEEDEEEAVDEEMADTTTEDQDQDQSQDHPEQDHDQDHDTTSSNPTPTPNPNLLSSDQLQWLAQGLQRESQRQGLSAGSQQTIDVPILDISDAVTPSLMISYINEISDEALEPLLELIPEGLSKTRQELVRIVQSSQFSQGLSTFSSTLNQPGLGSIVAQQLGYEYSGEGVPGFLNGVRNQSKKESGKGDNDKDDDEDDTA